MLAVCLFLRAPAGLFRLLILVVREQTLTLQLAHGNRQIEARESKIACLEWPEAHRRAQHDIAVTLASAVAHVEAAANEVLGGLNRALHSTSPARSRDPRGVQAHSRYTRRARSVREPRGNTGCALHVSRVQTPSGSNVVVLAD